MPIYPFSCGCGHFFDRLLAVTDNLAEQPCPGCGRLARHDYAAKRVQRPVIDGPTSGYYKSDPAFPRDPANPMKRIVPNKSAWKDHIKRQEGASEDAT